MIPPGGSTTAALRPAGKRVTERIELADTQTSELDDRPAGAALHLAPGTRIRQYEIIRELGRGGMGAVYLARDTRLARRVAIKILQSNRPQLTERFIVEARATARCSHENIVVIHDVDEHQGNPFMVLEYLRGQPLGRLLAAGPLPPSRAVELIVPVVRALACAHALDIVHRDLKPDNVLVTEAGTIKVLDFGIAKVLGQEVREAVERGPVAPERVRPDAAALTSAGAIVGTLPYMSPEQWGADEVDHRTDIWAVGIMLHEMLTGQHPLARRAGEQLMVTGVLDEPMPGVREAGVDVPEELARIVDLCLVKRKQERMDSARALLEALEPLMPGRYGRKLDAGESPFPGLTAFQEADADRFFGRSRDVAGVLARLRNQPLVAVVGPSGTGKSSFVRAGIIPALKGSGERWETFVVRPGRQPLAALAGLLLPLVTGSEGSPDDHAAAHQDMARRLEQEPGYLGTVLRSRASRQGSKILLAVDQLEELYTLVPDARKRAAFTACLSGVADDATAPLRVVVSLRSDFLDRVAEDRHFLAEVTASLVLLPPPDRDGLREALTHPAEMLGYRFEQPAIVDHMLDTLETTPGALPLLQFAATRLWETRDTGRRLLTAASYDGIGGVVGALASHADAVLSALPARMQSLARVVFQRLVTPERTRAIASMSELRALSAEPEPVQRLIDHLVGARLLVVQTGDGSEGASVEIVHESLIHGWPLLRRWLEEDQEDSAFLEQLRTAARQWEGRGRPPGLLWRGETLQEARRWRRRYQGPLSPLQGAYLDAAFALATRATRVKRLAIAGVMGFLVLLVAAGSVALLRIRTAEQDAQQQAVAARAAERKVREQLALLQAKDREKQLAEEKADQASAQVEHSKAELEVANEQLRRALIAAERAKAHAEEESARARMALSAAERAKAHAEEESARARMATEAERRANTELERLLDRERARAQRLERRLGDISSTLK